MFKQILTTLTKCFAQLCFSDLSQSEKHLDRVTGQVEYIVGVCKWSCFINNINDRTFRCYICLCLEPVSICSGVSVLTFDLPVRMSACSRVCWMGLCSRCPLFRFRLQAFHTDEGVTRTTERSGVMQKANVSCL